ncbi:hypothetical protein DWY77_00205 [Megamonas rupellensis]|jgi:LytS/YehU family sensor histidine kinase|uniref:Uncharacterized protein n=1 Tax=Megamonas rupellensis TaxID=491921 RepID=A0A412CI20_9FIRM|nr:hypothetical protein [Megamonas rupellensis]RGQ87024.1 hypothetical protein DWY77_00205 [Megamonas rupellensis]
MDNIQDRVDNWRKKIEEKKDKNEKLSEKEAKIILNEAIDISSGLVEDIINDCKKRNDDRKENFLQDIFSNINKSFSVLKEGFNYKDKLHVLVIDENNNALRVFSNNANKNILEELGRIIEHMENQKDFKVERSYLDDIVVRNYERANN